MVSKKEKLVLSHFRQNSRKNVTDISRETSLPITTIHDILRRLTEKNIIKRFVPILNYSSLGFRFRVFLTINVEKKEGFVNYLSKNIHLNSLSRIGNGYYYFIDAVFQEIEHYIVFKESLEQFNILKLKEFYVIKEIKKEKMFYPA
jgi:DNA-binding Lrp family transcriptional regulator